MSIIFQAFVSLAMVQAQNREGDLEPIPDICHGHTDGVRGEKSCHVEKFQISVHDR